MSNPCVYCHQVGDPETGYRRTCPGCGRSYLARFPRDRQEQIVTTPKAAAQVLPTLAMFTQATAAAPVAISMSGVSGERPAEMSNVQHIEQSPDQTLSGDRPATSADVRQDAAQGSLF